MDERQPEILNSKGRATQFLRQHAMGLCLALGAVCLIVIRACFQSITIDEATSYLLYASSAHQFTQWYPASGNHVLNSLLMRLVTSVFPLTAFTVRIPALFGGFVYIAAAFYLCLLLTGRKLLQIALLTCLIFNPLILDYLVAARGYGLALGFLMAAIAIIANAVMTPNASDAAFWTKCIWISTLVGLSLTANFSFAIADAVVLSVFFIWAARLSRQRVRLFLSCYGPAAAVVFLICGSVLREFPRDQLYFGANSVAETWRSIASSSFDDLNPNVVNPWLLKWMAPLPSVLPFVGFGVALLLIAGIEIGRMRSRDLKPQGQLAFVRLLVVSATLIFLVHWIAFHSIHLLLPKQRTALFFVPLLTLALGAAAALRLRPGNPRPVGLLAAGVLAVSGLYFLGCLRLGYFKEWKFDSVTEHLYWLVEDLHHRCGVEDFCIDWRYHVPLNFYRSVYNSSLAEFQASSSGELPPGKMAYAIFLPTSQDFIRDQHLVVTFHDDESGAGIAMRACPANPASRDLANLPAAGTR